VNITGILHKTAAFPYHVFLREQNRHFLENWGKISEIKMVVAGIGEAAVALLSYIINDLLLRAQRRKAINAVMLSCVQMPGVM